MSVTMVALVMLLLLWILKNNDSRDYIEDHIIIHCYCKSLTKWFSNGKSEFDKTLFLCIFSALLPITKLSLSMYSSHVHDFLPRNWANLEINQFHVRVFQINKPKHFQINRNISKFRLCNITLSSLIMGSVISSNGMDFKEINKTEKILFSIWLNDAR